MKYTPLYIVCVLCSGTVAFAQIDEVPQPDFLNINNLLYWAATNGMGGHNPYTNGPGVEFPKGSGKYVVFTDGFIMSGRVDRELRAGGSTNRYGLQNGKILENGNPTDPNELRYRLYKIKRVSPLEFLTLSDDEQKQLRKDFDEWPTDDGAPFLDRNGNSFYDPNFEDWLADSTKSDMPLFEGDQVLWHVSNDLDEVKTFTLFGKKPMGLELQVTYWAHKNVPKLDNVIFIKYLIINKSNENIEDFTFSKWCDVELGAGWDDFVGVDTVAQLGYAYNSKPEDAVYGSAPPAAGHVLLQGPIVPNPGSEGVLRGTIRKGYRNLKITRFYRFVNTNDFLRLLTHDYVKHTETSERVPFEVPGDPVEKRGWIEENDNFVGERQYGISTGQIDLHPGDTTEIVWALIVTQGSDRLNSIERLRNTAKDLLNDWSMKYPVSNLSVSELPEQPHLYASYPNPVKSTDGNAVIPYYLPHSERIALKVYNTLGNEVMTLYDGTAEPGTHSAKLNTHPLPPGMYFYELRTSSGTILKKFVTH